MTAAAGWPLSPDSPVARLDPRWRLAAAAVLVAACAAVRTPAAASLALACALGVAGLARVRAADLLPRLAALGLAVAPVVVLLPLTAGDADAPGFGPVRWSAAAVGPAAALGLRVLAVGTLALTVLAAAPLPVTLHAARALRVPGPLVHVSLLSYRYLFLLAAEFARVRTALRVRGFRNRTAAHAYRTAGRVVGALVARGADRADRVAAAMRCRGFAGEFRSLAEFRTRPADAAALAASVATAALLLSIDRLV